MDKYFKFLKTLNLSQDEREIINKQLFGAEFAEDKESFARDIMDKLFVKAIKTKNIKLIQQMSKFKHFKCFLDSFYNTFTHRIELCTYNENINKCIQTVIDEMCRKFLNDENLECLKLILEIGISVGINKVQDFNGNTVLHIASKQNNIELAKLFLNKGVDVNNQNIEGDTPLMLSTSLEMAKLLISEAKANVNIQNMEENTALIKIVYWVQNKDMVKLLIEAGADVNIKNRYYQTALSNAEQIQNKDIIKLLKEAGAI